MGEFWQPFEPLLISAGIGLSAGLAARRQARRGKHFSRAQLLAFAADMRRELYARATLSGQWIDLTDYLQRQPYYPGLWVMSVHGILYREKIVQDAAPRTDGRSYSTRLTGKALEEARMQRIVNAAEHPRTVNNFKAGVVQVGDHNQAHDVTANFGTDQTHLLAQLIAALAAVNNDATLQPQLREAAGRAAADLESAEPGRVPAILERVRGIVSVAATGFEAVRPILDAITSAH